VLKIRKRQRFHHGGLEDDVGSARVGFPFCCGNHLREIDDALAKRRFASKRHEPSDEVVTSSEVEDAPFRLVFDTERNRSPRSVLEGAAMHVRRPRDRRVGKTQASNGGDSKAPNVPSPKMRTRCFAPLTPALSETLD